MASMSFSEVADEGNPAIEGSQPMAPAGSTQIQLASPVAGSGIQGEIGAEDIKLPRINIVQKMSETAEVFRVGDVILEKTVKIGGTAAPLNFTCLRMRLQYQQDLPYGSEEMPLVFDRAEEVQAAGGSLIRGQINYFTKIAHLQLAVQAPEEIEEEHLDLFPFVHEGKNYAVAIMTVSRTAYGTLAKPLITHGFHTLKDGYFNGKFEMLIDTKRSPKGTYVVPVPLYRGRHTEADAAFFKSLL